MKVLIELPNEFIELCARDLVKPETVLRGFIADLCAIQTSQHSSLSEAQSQRRNDGYESNGIDERALAQEYYASVGYSFRDGYYSGGSTKS